MAPPPAGARPKRGRQRTRRRALAPGPPLRTRDRGCRAAAPPRTRDALLGAAARRVAMATAAAPETEDPQRPADTAAGALLACLSDACASPAAAYRPAPPASQISSDDDDSSKTSSLHGS